MPAKDKRLKFLRFRLLWEEGFTLIELLIVVSIIGILVTILLASLTQIQKGTRDVQRKNDLKAVASALERFYSDNSRYPNDNGGGKVSIDTSAGGNCTNSGSPQAWGAGVITCAYNGSLRSYLKQLPKETISSNLQYCYQVTLSDTSGNPQRYQLAAKLENSNDKEIVPTFTCGGPNGYNFKITPNQ